MNDKHTKPAKTSTAPNKANDQSTSHRQRATRQSYVGYLRSECVEALAELSKEAAQEMGFTKPPNDPAQQLAIIDRAIELYRERQDQRRKQQQADARAKRRARMHGTTIDRIDRREIIERDGSTCYLCRRTLELREIHLDHVIPLSKGGTHTVDNVRVACARCNVRKGATMPSDIPVYTPGT